MLEFNSFQTTDRDKIQSYISNIEYRNCDLAFANLFVWRFLYNTQIAEHNDFLFIKYWFHSKPYYMMPFGKGDLKEAIYTLMEYSKKLGERFCFQGLNPKMKAEIEEVMPDIFLFSTNRHYSDYIYLSDDLANLTGKKFQPKRNHINQFKRNYPSYKVVPLTEDIVPLCMDLENSWQAQNDSSNELLSTESEESAIKIGFKNFCALNLKGIALFVEDNLVAFTYGSPINENTFDVSTEKADISYIGAYSIINNEFAKIISPEYKYINREEDLGIEGLRKAKLSYNPCEILDKYTAKLKETTI